MLANLRYGSSTSVELKFPPGALVANCQAPRGEPLVDVRAAVAAALTRPRQFPSLAEAVLPSDRVTIALEPGVPQADEIVAELISQLGAAGVDLTNIVVLHAPDETELIPALVAAGGFRSLEGVEIRAHDPQDRSELGYLANFADGKPVYLNRAICEADFVAPIGCARLEAPAGYPCFTGGLFPAFSDREALGRFQSPKAAGAVRRKRLHSQAREVEWLLGAMFSLRVTPAGGDQVLAIEAGETASVAKHSRQACRAAWQFSAPSRADLVVAAIEGGPRQQTWANFARALAAAEPAVTPGGAIVVCCELETPPGPALQYVAGAESPEDALRDILGARLSDGLVAAQLLDTLENHRVYLLSRLEAGSVESLGVAPMSQPSELRRLVARHPSCILLANAQHALATVQSGSETEAPAHEDANGAERER